MKKELWVDVETTGTDPLRHEITQLSGILCGEEFNYFLRPTNWDIIEDKALEAQGKTIEDLKTHPEPQEAFQSFIDLCDRHINKFSKDDKAKIFAYNAKFDMDMLFRFFSLYSPPGSNGYKQQYWVGNYFKKNAVCVMYAYLFAVDLEKFPESENYKLSTVCNANGISFKAHDAAEDIHATQKLYALIRSKF